MRKEPETRKNRFSGSTTTLPIPESASDKPVTRRKPGGRQIGLSAVHSTNAKSPRTEMREPASNVKLERFVQCLKHPSAISSIDEGMQID
jgi:hypothetical protein